MLECSDVGRCGVATFSRGLNPAKPVVDACCLKWTEQGTARCYRDRIGVADDADPLLGSCIRLPTRPDWEVPIMHRRLLCMLLGACQQNGIIQAEVCKDGRGQLSFLGCNNRGMAPSSVAVFPDVRPRAERFPCS
jgi:hypothetical protein